LPEVWVPYGDVETLVTLQAENLGTLIEPPEEPRTTELERISAKVASAGSLFVCDLRPPTMELLGDLSPVITQNSELRVFCEDPKALETLVPSLKGRAAHTSPLGAGEGPAAPFDREVAAPGAKVFLGSAGPDPLMGIIDARVHACLNWAADSRQMAAEARKDYEPTPFEKSDSYSVLEELAGRIPDATFLTIVPRTGKVRSVLEDAPFDAVKNGFFSTSLPLSRGIIVGAGGRGYDDTLSASIRNVWSSLNGVRKSGVVLLIAECSGGLGSRALEMLVSGRIGEEGRRRERYVEGLEELYYLSKLKEEYEVLLLSGLPELYASKKLGFTVAKGSGEAVNRLLGKLGRTAKLNVVTRASECRILSA
jgi:hypothetical protein